MEVLLFRWKQPGSVQLPFALCKLDEWINYAWAQRTRSEGNWASCIPETHQNQGFLSHWALPFTCPMVLQSLLVVFFWDNTFRVFLWMAFFAPDSRTPPSHSSLELWCFLFEDGKVFTAGDGTRFRQGWLLGCSAHQERPVSFRIETLVREKLNWNSLGDPTAACLVYFRFFPLTKCFICCWSSWWLPVQGEQGEQQVHCSWKGMWWLFRGFFGKFPNSNSWIEGRSRKVHSSSPCNGIFQTGACLGGSCLKPPQNPVVFMGSQGSLQ